IDNKTVLQPPHTGNGGGIRNDGTMKLTDCTVSGNEAAGSGGGIVVSTSPLIETLTLNASTVTGNHAAIDGGGIFVVEGAIGCHDSTVSGNTAGDPPVASDCIEVAGGTGCLTCTA